MNTKRTVTVVVPVYADWPSLKDCIISLKKHVEKRHTIMLVNDNGPEADALEKDIKREITSLENFLYYRNSRNLGFIGNCNRAVLELDDTDNDVLLLNSDTKVTDGFLEEMLGVLYSDNKIGVASPRSNNATIATVPLSAIKQKGIDSGDSYKLFQKIREELPRYHEVPTAHGFCMLIRRSLIRKYGLFDEIFGMGYGEEVDFCQRIKKNGYKSVLCNQAYVFHLEARSFTMETKNKMLEKNNQIIWKRYPNYRQSVRDYIEKELVHEESVLPSKKTRVSRQRIKQTLRRNQTIYAVVHRLKNKLNI